MFLDEIVSHDNAQFSGLMLDRCFGAFSFHDIYKCSSFGQQLLHLTRMPTNIFLSWSFLLPFLIDRYLDTVPSYRNRLSSFFRDYFMSAEEARQFGIVDRVETHNGSMPSA